jgi:hypothetical protein
MLFMIIERFKDQDMLPVYKKLQHSGPDDAARAQIR